MDITPSIPSLARSRQQVGELMKATTTVACFGSRALLSLFVCAAPEPASVLAGRRKPIGSCHMRMGRLPLSIHHG